MHVCVSVCLCVYNYVCITVYVSVHNCICKRLFVWGLHAFCLCAWYCWLCMIEYSETHTNDIHVHSHMYAHIRTYTRKNKKLEKAYTFTI